MLKLNGMMLMSSEFDLHRFFSPREYIMRTILIALTLLALASIAPLAAEARPGGGSVVHSRRAPVIMHRALPPFRGQHVYGGR
jgi:hypothetical protein